MLRRPVLYVRLGRDVVRVRDVRSGADQTVRPATPFTGQRLLVDDFAAAQHALKSAFRSLMSGLSFRAPRVVMHQLDMAEGGLSPVETRVLRELALGAGASDVRVWTGAELSDDAVLTRFQEPAADGR